MTYACPHCNSDELEVVVSVWAELIQNKNDEFETDTSTPDNSAHEWDNLSAMRCKGCGYCGKVLEFETDEPPAAEPDDHSGERNDDGPKKD